MLIYPAIDLYQGQAVRLLKGDYNQKTVYSEDPVQTALDFRAQGAECIHIVDLEGAASGRTVNSELILRIKNKSGLFCEVGGGIRTMETVEYYLNCGIDRVILGTAAIRDEKLLNEAVNRYGERIAVSVDIRDGMVAVNGWKEDSSVDALSFCRKLTDMGIRTIICTDISRDGAMRGTNLQLYRELSETLSLQIIASGGVSSISDIRELRAMNLHGAIIGKAYYIGAISLREAIAEAA